MYVMLNEAEAAGRIGLGASTLQRYRLHGGGPKFIRLGKRRIAYRDCDIDEWIASRVVSSTSEKVAA